MVDSVKSIAIIVSYFENSYIFIATRYVRRSRKVA
jgi:hypothetical protein